MDNQPYAWAVVGAGPAGMASVGLLIDAGVAPEQICWLDPSFTVGDFAGRWHAVSSNTQVKLFIDFLSGIKAFQFSVRPEPFELEALPSEGYCELEKVAEPLAWITEQLQRQVSCCQGWVQRLQPSAGAWQLETSRETIRANKVILATGAEPKLLPPAALPAKATALETIPLTVALDPEQLAACCQPDDRIAVFGSSHSAMIILRSLVELGIKNIQNFYLSPPRFAVPMGDWTLYDNTGLKGETAAWVRDVLLAKPLSAITRYPSTMENLTAQLPSCQKAIYAVGFDRRLVNCSEFNLQHYDTSNGIIAPGLFGCGLAYPRLKSDPNGRQEFNVGLWKFLTDLKLLMPLWLRYGC